MALLLWAVLAAWITALLAILLTYRQMLHRIWREPVMRHPVLVLESDDWGAGPLVQAGALGRVAGCLERHRDAGGRPAVMSLAVVLAVLDGPAIAADLSSYRRVCLDAPSLAPVLAQMRAGEAAGVFSLQLHGLEHFWPHTLMQHPDPAVQAWLRQPDPASTEALPSHLQSRWVDARQLPSSPLPDGSVQQGVAEEVAAWRRIMGTDPLLVVPPTFVWTPAVERAWAAQGLQCVVTPGQRYTTRGLEGRSLDDGIRFANGDVAQGITYLVRFDYFEPSRGRDAAYALKALQRAADQGRPCVLENHRTNFCADEDTTARSLQQLDVLLSGALGRHPDVRFMASIDLFRAVSSKDPEWVLRGFQARLPFLWARLKAAGRPWKLLRWLGLAALAEVVLGPRLRRSPQVQQHG